MRRGADLGGPNGYTDFGRRLVMVRDDVDDAQAVKTLAHEAGHVILHPDQQGRDCRGILEVEAESVAYMVTSAHGLDSSQYTFNYVAGWALNAVTEQRDLADILRSTGQRVIGAADLILQTTQPAPTITDTALDALESDIRVQTDPTRWEAVSVGAVPSTPEPPTVPSPRWSLVRPLTVTTAMDDLAHPPMRQRCVLDAALAVRPQAERCPRSLLRAVGVGPAGHHGAQEGAEPVPARVRIRFNDAAVVTRRA